MACWFTNEQKSEDQTTEVDSNHAPSPKVCAMASVTAAPFTSAFSFPLLALFHLGFVGLLPKECRERAGPAAVVDRSEIYWPRFPALLLVKLATVGASFSKPPPCRPGVPGNAYFKRGRQLLLTRGYLFHHDPTKDDARCAAYPDPGNIAVAVKTSAAQASLEELNRVATIFHCLRSDRLVFFSDLEQTLGSYHLHDVVSDVSPDLLKLHHDFTLYRQQKKLAKSGLSVRDIQQTPVLSSDMPVDQEEASKNLDKYKFLHMVEKMWEMQPDKEWYVFADASAYYVWPGLVRYLKEQDPTRPRFLSKATRIGQSELDIPHGETGFILSGVAVRALVDSGKSIAAEWDKKMPFMESGHHAVATAINAELNLTLSNTWPVMIGDSPGAIPFQTNIWCEPVVALSNISSDLALRILAKEQSYKYTSPRDFLTFRDIFFELGEINPGTIRTISNPDLSYMLVNKWDNLADVPDREWSIDWRDTATQDKGLIADMPDDPNHTADDCARACNAFRDCMQFSHMSFDARFYIDDKVLSEGGLCYLSRLYRFGSYRPLNQWEDDGNNGNNAPNSVLNTQVWTSGWIHKRWEAFSGKLTQACSATM